MLCQYCCYPIGEMNFDKKRFQLIHLDQLKDETGNLLYPNSQILYCKLCWDERDKHLKCEKCNKDYQACWCDKPFPIKNDLYSSDYIRICYDCRCAECNYCIVKMDLIRDKALVKSSLD